MLLWLALAGPVLLGDRLARSVPVSWWQTAGGLLLLAAAVALSRRWPVPALLLVAGLSLATAPALFTVSYIPALSVLGYLAGRRETTARSALLAFTAIAVVGTVGVLGAVDVVITWLVLIATLLFGAAFPWLVGRHRRQDRALVAAGWSRAAQLEREQWIIADRARLRERARIAQDMHDSLGHDLSLIALRAGALQVAPGLGAEHRAAARELRVAAAEATERLREIIGVLRDATAAPSAAPVAGPARETTGPTVREDGTGPAPAADAAPLTPVGESIEALVERAADSGLPVRLLRTAPPPAPYDDQPTGAAGTPPDRAAGTPLDRAAGPAAATEPARGPGHAPEPPRGTAPGAEPSRGTARGSGTARTTGVHGTAGTTRPAGHAGPAGTGPGTGSGTGTGADAGIGTGAGTAGLAPMAERAAHRVVQESLTNAAKHAPGAEVTVTVEERTAPGPGGSGRAETVVRVVTAGAPGGPAGPDGAGSRASRDVAAGGPAGAAGPAGARPGTGLLGLRERVALVGGDFFAGPRDGGFEVVARLPHGPVDAAGPADPGGAPHAWPRAWEETAAGWAGAGGEPAGGAPGHPRAADGGPEPGAGAVREFARVRRATRRRLVRSVAVAGGLAAVVVAAAVGWYAYTRTHSVLEPRDYAALRIGQPYAEVERVLPDRVAPDPPRDRAPAAPPGARCRYYRADDELFVSVDHVRLCFRDGRLVAKDLVPGAGAPPRADRARTGTP
ncbi:sensor histidine kinase [Streptomyces pactum]|uniref:sensor histidine kinase n=1 Tax=Streptomyces pactum TaxID=68249 RepID=UPI0036FD4E14